MAMKETIAVNKDNNTYYEIDQKWLEDNKDVVDDLLHKNWEKAVEDTSNAEYLSFEYEGMTISNPLVDETGRFPLTLEQSIEKYGEQNVMTFLSDFKTQQVNPNVVTLFSDDTTLLKELKETYGKSVVIEDNIEHLRSMQYEIENRLDINPHPSAFVVAVGRDKEHIDHLNNMCEDNDCICNSCCHMEQKNSEIHTLDDYVHSLEAMKSFISDLEKNKTSAKFDMWFFSGGHGEDFARYTLTDNNTNKEIGYVDIYSIGYDDILFEGEYQNARLVGFDNKAVQLRVCECVDKAASRNDLVSKYVCGAYCSFTREEFIQAVKKKKKYIIGEDFPREEFLSKLKEETAKEKPDVERD